MQRNARLTVDNINMLSKRFNSTQLY